MTLSRHTQTLLALMARAEHQSVTLNLYRDPLLHITETRDTYEYLPLPAMLSGWLAEECIQGRVSLPATANHMPSSLHLSNLGSALHSERLQVQHLLLSSVGMQTVRRELEHLLGESRHATFTVAPYLLPPTRFLREITPPDSVSFLHVHLHQKNNSDQTIHVHLKVTNSMQQVQTHHTTLDFKLTLSELHDSKPLTNGAQMTLYLTEQLLGNGVPQTTPLPHNLNFVLPLPTITTS